MSTWQPLCGRPRHAFLGSNDDVSDILERLAASGLASLVVRPMATSSTRLSKSTMQSFLVSPRNQHPVSAMDEV